MFVFITIVHILLSVFMIFVILLQPGKDAGMGAALGGGAATSAFGGRGGATFLTKLTAFCAIAFFVTSLGLSFVGLKATAADSIVEQGPVTPAAATDVPSEPSQAAAANEGDAPKPTPVEGTPKAADAVPAEKLPNP